MHTKGCQLPYLTLLIFRQMRKYMWQTRGIVLEVAIYTLLVKLETWIDGR